MTLTPEKRALVQKELNWAHSVAKGAVTGRKLQEADMEDLLQCAVVALMDAAITYDPDHPSGASFRTYACCAIRNAVRAALRAQERFAKETPTNDAAQLADQCEESSRSEEQPDIRSLAAFLARAYMERRGDRQESETVLVTIATMYITDAPYRSIERATGVDVRRLYNIVRMMKRIARENRNKIETDYL